MAFTASNGRTQTSLSDINITPLVDVVLVLLIIFMVTAPVLQSGIEVNVPKTRTVKEITEERLVISIDKQQRVFLGNDAININEIAAKLRAEDSRPAASVHLYPRRRRRALRRLRHRDGRSQTIRHHECQHRDPTAGRAWQPTLKSSSNTTAGDATSRGRSALHVCDRGRASCFMPWSRPAATAETWGSGGRRCHGRDPGEHGPAAGQSGENGKRAGQRIQGVWHSRSPSRWKKSRTRFRFRTRP